MESILGALGPIFWGLILLSALVFVHEGGHFLAARACGVRVLEFFLGMPCRFRLAHVSKKIGTTFGVTPILIGGYAEISGMDPTVVPSASRVLGFVHEQGVTSVERIAETLGLTYEEAEAACMQLYNMGSITDGDALGGGDADNQHDNTAREDAWVAAAPRDPKGYTIYDGKFFDRAHATSVGESWQPPMGEDEFYEFERARTYAGVGFWKRAFMLIAGIAVNIITGFLLVIGVYSILGVSVPIDVNAIGSVVQNSPAQQAGLIAGDHILAIDDTDVDSWSRLLDVAQHANPGDTLSLKVWRPADPAAELARLDDINGPAWDESAGSIEKLSLTLDEDGRMGIGVAESTVRLDPLTACDLALKSIAMTAKTVASLLNPQHTMEVLDNSTSVVGISVMSAQAAENGASSFLELAAMISFSLAFMNLLPIPPLDGGKLVIEAVQAVAHREVPLKVQSALSTIGIILFGLLFIYMLFNDIIRFF